MAPVSPRDLAKANTQPEKIPGRAIGNNILLKVVKGAAPNVLDAVSKTGFTSSILALIVKTTYGKVSPT